MGSGIMNKVGGRPRPKDRYFVLQWHLTARCDEDCRHCYAKDSPDLKGQLDNELGLEDCRRVLASFDRFIRRNGFKGRINLTGGNPLLKDGLLDLIRDARGRDMKVGILGNPGLLDDDRAMELKRAGVFRFQLSIDGLRETHDRLRGRRGHFDDTMRAVRVLNRVGIPSVVMFTLSKENKEDLPVVAELVAGKDVRIFDFARIVPQGRGRDIGMLDPLEYRQVLLKVLRTYQRLKGMGSRTHFGRKEALWNLLYLEEGLQRLPPWDGLIHSGCSVGSKVLTILADGTVYPCRRLPITLGKVPRDDISDIFFDAKEHRWLRDLSNFKKCRSCELFPYCRGCPAVAFGALKDPFGPDPQCWKKVEDGRGVVPKAKAKRFSLQDFQVWKKKGKERRQCASCDGACGGCGSVCAACSEVCASCSGCG